jgi:hypothetical protein
MRILRPDLLRDYSRSPLDLLETVDLRRYGIVSLGNSFSECPRLQTIFLSDNKLENLSGIERAPALWNLDVSNNSITNVDGLCHIPAAGWLNLSKNNLTYGEVAKLVHIPLINVILEDNLALLNGVSRAQYRTNLIYLLPKAWMIDHAFITHEERSMAIEYFEQGEGVGSEVATLRALHGKTAVDCSKVGSGMLYMGGIGVPTNIAYNDENCMREGERETRVQKFLICVASEPHHPSIVQSVRLKRIVLEHNLESKRVHKHFSSVVSRPGLVNIELGYISHEEFKNLQRRQLLDLAVMLTVSIMFPVPHNVVLDALTLLLEGEVDMQTIEGIANLQRYGRMVVAHRIKHVLGKYIEAKNPAFVLNFIEKELFEALPDWATRLHEERPANERPLSESERIRLEHLSRHSVILFSRSPNFPTLVRTRDTSMRAHEKYIYETIYPLLELAGMTDEDLHTPIDEAQWLKRVENPSRSYTRPWDPSSESSSLEVEKGVKNDNDYFMPDLSAENCEENFAFLSEAFAPEEGNNPCASPIYNPSKRGNSRVGPLSILGGRACQAASIPGVSYPVSTRCYTGIRVPRAGERVELETQSLGRIFPRIVQVFDAGNVIMLESFPGASRATQCLLHRDVFWNPNGYWRHGSAVHFDAKKHDRFRLSKATRLHRVHTGFTKSGILASEGVANKILPEALAKLVLETHNVFRFSPNPLNFFANNTTWDPNFVVAPPKLVQAQNMYARATGQGGDWDPIKTIPFIVKNSGEAEKCGYINKAVDLRPLASGVYSALEKRLRREEKNNDIVTSKQLTEDVDKEINGERAEEVSSSFFMTDVPNPTGAVLTNEDRLEDSDKNASIGAKKVDTTTAITLTDNNISVQNEKNNPTLNPKGTHSWYAVPNKTSILVAPRLGPTVNGPYFRPNKPVSSEKDSMRIKNRFAEKKWAKNGFAKKTLPNRLMPKDKFHEPAKARFVPVQGSMPTPLLPQPDLSAGLRARVKYTRRNFFKQFRDTQDIEIRARTQGSISAILSRQNSESRYLMQTPKGFMAEDDPRRQLDSPAVSGMPFASEDQRRKYPSHVMHGSSDSGFGNSKRGSSAKTRRKKKKPLTRLAKRQMQRHVSMPTFT